MAQATADNETIFIWVGFQCVKEVTGISPRVFVTDGDLAVNGAFISRRYFNNP